MSYNNAIPNVTDFLAISQKQILSNFQSINSAFAQNHVALGKDNQGQHNALILRPEGADPTTDPMQAAFYNKLVNNVPQLFYRSNSDLPPIQISNSNSTINSSATSYQQSSFLAGPFTIYTGIFFEVASGTLVALLPATLLIYVGLTMILNGPFNPILIPIVDVTPTSIMGNQFTIKYSPNVVTTKNPTVYYMAIGQ